MHRADNVLMFGVVNGPVRETEAKVLSANPLIGADQANFVGHGFVDESFQVRLLHVLNDAGDADEATRSFTPAPAQAGPSASA